MPNLEKVKSARQEIIQVATKHGARNVRLFGSQVKGTANVHSDVDVLVEFDQGRSLLDRIALIQDLEDLLEIKVDVVTEKALHPAIREQILQESVLL